MKYIWQMIKTEIPSNEAIELLDKEKIEFIVKSPGIPWKVELLVKAKNKNIKIISEIDLAYKYMNKKYKDYIFYRDKWKNNNSH